MENTELVQLVNKLRAEKHEAEWLEFKQNYAQPKSIGEYLSALANSACVMHKDRAYLVFGIDDKTHAVVGTKFNPESAKGQSRKQRKKSNQNLLMWLKAGLEPPVGFRHRIVDHPEGRVVLFEVWPASGEPVKFLDQAYGREGSNTTKLSPEKARAIWNSQNDWSAELCKGATLKDLDPDAVQKARTEFAVKNPAQKDAISRWGNATFLNKAKLLMQGAVTNTALLLLGREESITRLSPAVAKITWVLKDAANREQGRPEHIYPPFLLAGDRLLRHIRNITVRELPSGTLFPKELTQYDPWVIREALHNAIAHQDYRLYGRIAVVEFPDRLLLTNVGGFLPGSVETVIQQDAPQSYYRNRFLSDAMVGLNMIDTQGGGIKRMFNTQKERSFPLPDYDLDKTNVVSVSIPGQILDERYTRLLMQRTDLSLEQAMLLDRVQRKRAVTREEHRRLKSAGLVEGRYPNLMVAGPVAKATGDVGRYVREKGFTRQYYLDMILKVVEEGPVGRKEINDALVPALPDRLTEEQKRIRTRNLIQVLRRAGRIVNEGNRARPAWVLARP